MRHCILREHYTRITCTFFCALIICFLIFCDFSFASGVNGSFRLDEYNFVPLLYRGEETGYQACTIKGSAYIPVEAMEEYGDCGSFEIDDEGHRVVFTPAEMDIFTGDDETTDFIQKYCGSCSLSFKNIYNRYYVSLNVMKDFIRLSYNTDGTAGLSNDDETDITYVDMEPLSDEQRMGRTVRKTVGAGSLFSSADDSVTVRKDQQVYILGETPSFYKIRTISGQVCYVNREDVNETMEEAPDYDFIFAAKQKKGFRTKINLVWTSPNSNGISSLAPDAAGIDVVSPVWLSQQVEGGGNVTSFCDRGYTDLAHERGLQVWVTLNNDMTTTGSTNYTGKVFADSSLRRKTIAQYLFYAMMADADGLCIDYEDVRSSDGDGLTLFTSELSYYCERLGLYLSSAVYVPSSWNYSIYQYDLVSDSLDYFCVMTYDEHFNGSLYAGSVSSEPFYTEMIEEMLKYTSADKVLMGIPFYTRIWTVDDQNRRQGVQAVIMSTARERVKNAGAAAEWSSEDGQYFASWKDGDLTVKVWLEDARSIAERLSNVYYYDIAGSCCWRYGQQEEGVMDVFEEIYKNGISPGAFTDPY